MSNLKRGWRITKFWMEDEGYKYEVGYWTEQDVEDIEHFDDKEHAEEYLEDCIEEDRRMSK
tara:strand:+ start:14 stop:196 length:183 start_codon:yes stop_codon:yes gene_type:complete